MTSVLLQIIGAVALLLWGTRMLKNGLIRAYATSLQKMIANNTSNRAKAFFAGLGVTAVLQSSTATTMICASFASKNMIGTTAALAVIIGADVSTTIVAQILTFDLSWLTPVLLVTGVFMHHRYEHKGRKKHIARALIGLGLILLSLSLIKQSAAPLSTSETLPVILSPLEQDPILALIIAAAVTWMLHSSLAAVLIIASLNATGLLNLHLGLLLVLGANLGGAIIPYAMTYKMSARARRITTGNVIMRSSCVLIALIIIELSGITFESDTSAGGRDIINFHMLFNAMLAIIFLPLIKPLSKLCKKLVPKKPKQISDDEKPLYLDETALTSPTIALAAAARETLRAAKIVEGMFTDSMIALKNEDPSIIEKVQKDDDKVDMLHNEIKLYLTRVSEEMLDPKESDRFIQILSFSTNLEHIGDIIDKSISELINIKVKNQHRFSDEGFKEISEFHQTILINMKIAQAIFMSEDPKLARQLVDGKTSVREAAKESTDKHFQRLRQGIPETVATSALHTDLIRDFRRINSYITTVAYSILDTAKAHQAERKPQ